jgi:hypothetical protein
MRVGMLTGRDLAVISKMYRSKSNGKADTPEGFGGMVEKVSIPDQRGLVRDRDHH